MLLLDGTAVGDDKAFEAPFLAQDALQQRLRRSARRAGPFPRAVGVHHRSRFCLDERGPERRQKYLAHHAFGIANVVAVTASQRTTVRRKVLRRGDKIALLIAVM